MTPLEFVRRVFQGAAKQLGVLPVLHICIHHDVVLTKGLVDIQKHLTRGGACICVTDTSSVKVDEGALNGFLSFLLVCF